MTVDLTAAEFHDEAKAREWLEGSRWPNGPYCPHCGSFDARDGWRGKPHREGLFHCRDCRGQFTVLTGSVMESSHLPLTKWVLAIRLMTASKKGMSAHQIHRMLNVTYKTAWFMCHRIREAMRETDPLRWVAKARSWKPTKPTTASARRLPSCPVAASASPPSRAGLAAPRSARSSAWWSAAAKARMTHMNTVNAKNLRDFMVRNADRQSRLHTDESRLYDAIGSEFAKHETVNHGAKEYARGDVTTNSVEGLFGIFKRGMIGIYQHCGEQHLQRYLDEFTFRYNNRSKLGDRGPAARPHRGLRHEPQAPDLPAD